MTDEQQLKLQAFFDGELPESDAREVAAWLAQDSDATALFTELKNTRDALKEFEQQPGSAGVSPAGLKLPESREFYWSKIKREIERTAAAPAPVPRASLFNWVRRAIMPLGAVAVLFVAGFITFHQMAGGQRPVPMAANVMLGDVNAFTYRDDSQDMTVVWLSYPTENKFAQKPSGDTLPPK
jgi:anti-sigma factor RsiW